MESLTELEQTQFHTVSPIRHGPLGIRPSVYLCCVRSLFFLHQYSVSVAQITNNMTRFSLEKHTKQMAN